MRRRYRKDDDVEDIFRGLFGLSILGSLGLYFADRTLFYEAAAGLALLIILIVVGAILWGRYRDRKRFEKYRAITKDYGSVLNNFIDQFGRAKAKEAAFTHQQYAFTRERLTYMQDDLAKHGVVLSVRLKTS